MSGRTQETSREGTALRLRGSHPLWPAFPGRSAEPCLSHSPTALWRGHDAPTTPYGLGPQAITPARFGLFPFRSPLLRESSFLSFPPATEMCHFTGLPSPALCVQAGIRAHYHAWVSPFGNPRVKGRSAPHRGLSQPSTSFLGSWRQGIHRVPFVILTMCRAHLRVTMQFSRYVSDAVPPPRRNGPRRADP